jgi:prepilin signal peptidase PulO-like enzyme (type II secretory pathway)
MYANALAIAYVAVLAAIAVIDFRTRRAPNAIVYPATLLGALASIPLGTSGMREAWLGGLAAFAVMLLIYVAGRGKMGAGDAKTSALAGLAVGLHGVFSMLAATFLAGSAVAIVLLALRIRDRKDSVAFTPFIFIGVLISMYLTPGYLVA